MPDVGAAPRKRVIVRCLTKDVEALARALEAAGFPVLETAAEVLSAPRNGAAPKSAARDRS